MNTRLKCAVLALFLSACVTASVPRLAGPALKVRTGKSDPDPSMRELGPIEAVNGNGCGGFGAKGTYEGAIATLRNKAAARGANYVQIFTMTEPHSEHGCFDNAFVIRGMAFYGNRSAVGPTGVAPQESAPTAGGPTGQ